MKHPFLFGYTEIPEWFYSKKWHYYQKTKGRVVCYISKQIGDHWQYKVQMYYRGKLTVCDLEYRHSDIDQLILVANRWLEQFKDSEKEDAASHYYHPFNPGGYWQTQYLIDKRGGLM